MSFLKNKKPINTTGQKMIGHEDDVFNVLKTEILARKPNFDLKEISRAYQFAKKAHQGQFRLSGEPYIIHPIEATRNLLAINMDLETIQACLLHDVVEDTPITSAEIEREFGSVVNYLTMGVEKVAKIRYRGEERQLESLRKMFIAMVGDLRVVFIKLADRIHNMETLHFHPKIEKQRRIAEETLKIYVPIAEKLGIYSFKQTLEDLTFKILWPEEYRNLVEFLAKNAPEREKKINYCITEFNKIFPKNGQITCSISGRVKNKYSIFNKMKRKNITADEMYDLFALRIVTTDKTNCYIALGIIHEKYTPMISRIKDYIAMPKLNGYQSLHTTVLGLLKATPVEIQIRTKKMHEEAEYGIAAHFGYKNGKNENKIHLNARSQEWLTKISELETNYLEFKNSLEMEVLKDRIFALTPNGDIKDLPRGSTPLDFAYAVHSKIGNKCYTVRVNGRNTSLSYQLSSGDIIEIITRNNIHPKLEWLSLTKTRYAKSCIRSYLNSQNIDNNIYKGQELVNKRLIIMNLNILDEKLSILKHFDNQILNLKERQKLLEKIGVGALTISQLFNKLGQAYHLVRTCPSQGKPNPDITTYQHEKVYIAGIKDLEYHLASCCIPTTNDQIFAHISPGQNSIAIHKNTCSHQTEYDDRNILKAIWEHNIINTKIKICINRDFELVNSIIKQIKSNEINIISVKTNFCIENEEPAIHIDADIYYENNKQLEKLIDDLTILNEDIKWTKLI